ncbi:MAG: hypothetical protein IMW96_07655 [Thermoanaerobacteraceae bacterium]|nr:hypothetical protein [Thermoanaerobacteraceae bacterium]
MSLNSRREYLNNMHQRYSQAASRTEKSQIIDEVVKMLGYNRKYAIYVLNNPIPAKKPAKKRSKPLKYLEAFPAIQLVWEALDYPCAERLHPVLLRLSSWPSTESSSSLLRYGNSWLELAALLWLEE